MQDRQNKVLAAETIDEKWSLWAIPLKSENLSLEETLIRENMEYLHLTRDEVVACWREKGTEKIKEKWLRENPQTEVEIHHYYNALDLYIPELSSWHCIEKNEALLKIVEFLQLCVKNNFTTFLDFGAEIGSSGIVFSYYGFDITLADISDAMLDYAKWRLAKHNVNAKFVDLKIKSIPDQIVECATAIEVLEHVTDPIGAMDKIRRALKIGGYAFVTTPFYDDVERPQHIVRDIEIATKFQELGLELVSEEHDELFRIYKRID